METYISLFGFYFKLTFMVSVLFLLTGDLNAEKTKFSEKKMEGILQRYPEADANNDGTVTQEEIDNFIKKRLSGSAKRGNSKNAEKSFAPTISNMKYGAHKLQAVDIWLAKPKKQGVKTPLCIFIHGGGFQAGDKKTIPLREIKKFLNSGISVASMNYRLTEKGKFPYPTQMHDCARGIQFIRSKAAELNIDPNRIACYGNSAGAGISLWLAFHDDLANYQSKEQIEGYSTRIIAAGAVNGQSSYDMRTIKNWFAEPNLIKHGGLKHFYGIKKGEATDSPRVIKLAKDASPIFHLSKDDPPVYMFYKRQNSKVTAETNPNIWIHHPTFGVKLQEAMGKLGIESILCYPGKKDSKYKDVCDFLIQKLSE